MEELKDILANKIIQLNEKFGNKTISYNNETKDIVTYKIEEIVQDICCSHNYTYAISKFNTNTTLFEINTMFNTLVLLVLFRNRGVQVVLSSY